jgi:hypothetical protein
MAVGRFSNVDGTTMSQGGMTPADRHAISFGSAVNNAHFQRLIDGTIVRLEGTSTA